MRALFVERFGHDRKARLTTREREQLEPAFAESLERVGRAAGLERAAAEGRRARVLHRASRGENLLLGLDRTGTGDDDDVLTAERDTWCDRDDRIVRPPFARNLLVRLADVNDLGDAGQGLDARSVHAAVVPDE